MQPGSSISNFVKDEMPRKSFGDSPPWIKGFCSSVGNFDNFALFYPWHLRGKLS